MGYAARANLRSPEGRKPRKFNSLHRVWRGVAFFKDNRAAFDEWLAGKNLTPTHRAALEHIWNEQHPQPRVTLA